MSVVSVVFGRSVNSPHFQVTGFSTSPSTNSRQAWVGISGWMPRSSTGQVSTWRCPGGRRSEWAAVLPVSRRPSSAHFCLLSISLFLSLPNRVTSSSDIDFLAAFLQMLRPVFSQYGARSLRLKILPESSRGRAALNSTTFGTL